MSTLLHELFHWGQQFPDAPAQRFKESGSWKTITAREYADRVYYMASYLESQGFQASDVSVIFAYNSPEWVHVDLGMVLLGGKSSGLYPNSSLADIQYILNHTQAKVLAVQNRDYYLKITGPNEENPLPNHIEKVIVFDGDTSMSSKAVAYEEAIALGKKSAADKNPKRFLDRLDKDAGSFLVYTSGTTGSPKGVMVSLDNLGFVSQGAINVWDLPVGEGDLFSFLPLCHVAEKEHGIGVGILGHFCVSFCSTFENLATEIVEIQPKLLLSVPRLWEKMMEGVKKKLDQAPATKKKLAHWAMGVARHYMNEKIKSGGSVGLSDVIQYRLADRLVLRKVRHALGLAKAELTASGAAALSPHVVEWFRGLGLRILNTMGQSECAGAYTYEDLKNEGIGTCGVPLPGAEIKIAQDGEILTRGRHVFKGYYKNEEATNEVLREGWLHTGDLGEFNEKGHLVIRGRKKEVMKTSGGKLVAPLPIEEKIKQCDFISQVCMVGDGKKYFSALITLTEETIEQLKDRPEAVENDLVVVDSKIIEPIQRQIEKVNAQLANYEKVKNFTVLAKEFSIDAGEMTPTMKMKRNVVEEHYSEIIDKMYASSEKAAG